MHDEKAIAGNGDNWVALYAGDTALIIEFGSCIDKGIVRQVNDMDALLSNAIQNQTIAGVQETVPTFRSLAIIYDPDVVHPKKLIDQLIQLQTHTLPSQNSTLPPRHWQLPVLYNDEHGPDLKSVATLTGLSKETVINMHVSCTFSAYMLGFLPGYAFLGDTPKPLHLNRREQPRLRVPAGSVAIAMQLTGIYPWDSPGGWHILGNCPVPMFDAHQNPPAVLKAGDQVSFIRVDEQQFCSVRDQIRNSPVSRDHWLVSKHEQRVK